eukprot:scaffold82128_cov25-Tisochrysis_lutea.AAC.4
MQLAHDQMTFRQRPVPAGEDLVMAGCAIEALRAALSLHQPHVELWLLPRPPSSQPQRPQSRSVALLPPPPPCAPPPHWPHVL